MIEIIVKSLVFLAILKFVDAGYIPPGPRYTCPNKTQLISPCTCLQGGDDGLKIRCENSNLAAMSVGLNNLATFMTPIEELTIHKCHFERLYGSLLYKLKLRILRIEETPIKTIDQYTFLGVNDTLQEIHLINSSINVFPKEAFQILGNLTTLNIKHHNFTKLEKDVFYESRINIRLEKLHLTDGPLADIPIESFQPLRKLKTLDLNNNALSTLKRNQFKGLRDVEVLDLSYNNLPKMEASAIVDLTKLSWCNLSHNAIADLPRGTFARNAVLRVLNLSQNKIKKLDTNSFRGMRFLRRLYLSDNEITDVGRGTFSSVAKIGTIDLARNRITKIDYQMFFQLNFIEIIDVSENAVTEIQKLSFKDIYLAKINISHNQISKIEDGSFENCANITLLDLSYNNITSIPRNTFDPTTYATELQLSYNLLTNMSQIPLHNMTGLKILNVSHNLIEVIPRNTFPKLYELHTIDVSHNKLSLIANAVLQTLFSLRSLNLSHNSLDVIKPPTFGTLPTLLDMDLSFNNLTDIAKGAFTKLTSLRVLNVEGNLLTKMFTVPISLGHLKISNNLLTELPLKTWPSMNSILALDFSRNRFENRLMHGSFSNLLTLQRLDLSYNGISEIPWESLSELTALQYLYLQHNNLTKLSKAAFGRLPVVFELDLSYNQIGNISVNTFEGLLQLLKLDMSNNLIHHIPTGAFRGLVSLRSLHLSNNAIEKLDNKTNSLLEDCLSLEKIDLSHNKISFVTRKSFPSNPYIPYRLREIDLSYNSLPVLTYDITFGTSKLTKLNVSHNMLNDLHRGVLGNLTALHTLDLSFNELEDIISEPNAFNLPVNITNLIMNDNKINELPIAKIVNATKLQSINLMNNELTQFPHEFVAKVEKGLNVYFDGNPLKCDCMIRPLKHFLLRQTEVPLPFRHLMCNEPQHIAGQLLHSIQDGRLNCINASLARGTPKASEVEQIYQLQPDLNFRHIRFTRRLLEAQWFITSQADVADVDITVRDKSNSLRFSRTMPYESRVIRIDLDSEEASDFAKSINEGATLQLCALARDSAGEVRSWFSQQCHSLPTSQIRSWDSRSKKILTIFPTDDKNYIRNSGQIPKSSSYISALALFIIYIII